jgi:hypothetical protein
MRYAVCLTAVAISCGGTTINVGTTVTHSLSITANGLGGVSTDPAGITCRGGVCSSKFDQGTTVTVTAHPDMGASFSGWSGACSGVSTSCNVTMGADMQATATFTTADGVGTHSISVGVTGSGIVTSRPPGINCPSACTARFTDTTAVTLDAVTQAGAVFSGWTGACAGAASCVVTVSQDATLTATFSRPANSNSLAISIATGAGTVTSTPAGIDCPTNACSFFFPTGSSVTLVASPSPNSAFNSWSGGGCGASATCTVKLITDTPVSAAFTNSSGY